MRMVMVLQILMIAQLIVVLHQHVKNKVYLVVQIQMMVLNVFILRGYAMVWQIVQLVQMKQIVLLLSVQMINLIV